MPVIWLQVLKIDNQKSCHLFCLWSRWIHQQRVPCPFYEWFLSLNLQNNFGKRALAKLRQNGYSKQGSLALLPYNHTFLESLFIGLLKQPQLNSLTKKACLIVMKHWSAMTGIFAILFFGCFFVLIVGFITWSLHCLMQNFTAKRMMFIAVQQEKVFWVMNHYTKVREGFV